MKQATENDIRNQIRDYLRGAGWLVIRVHCGGVKTAGGHYVRFCDTPGVSDLVCCAPDGRFVAVEVKKPGGRVGPMQTKFVADVALAGGFGLVVDDLADLYEQLKGDGYTNLPRVA